MTGRSAVSARREKRTSSGRRSQSIVLVTLERENAHTLHEMMEVFRHEPEILEAWNVTGDHDFAVRVAARDMEGYDDLVQRLFSANDKIRSFQTLVVIREAKLLSAVPVG